MEAASIGLIVASASLLKTLLFVSVLRPFRLYGLYGALGALLFFFGSRTTWSVEAQVLGRLDEDDAMQFKKSVQDECTMVSVAVSTSLCDLVASGVRSFLMTHRLLS